MHTYSTHAGGKKFSKALKRRLGESGIIYPLHKCQEAAARAAGFAGWHHLESVLATSSLPMEASHFRQRLLSVLPMPCRSTVLDWHSDSGAESELGSMLSQRQIPPRWFHDVSPYSFSSAALHRAETRLLRPGSGQGQRLRLNLVLGPLLGPKCGWLDPVSLSLRINGELIDIFGKDFHHQRFEREFKALCDGGIFVREVDGLRITPPSRDLVLAHVARMKISKVRYGGSESSEDARCLLAMIGVSDEAQIAHAVNGKSDWIELLERAVGIPARFPELAKEVARKIAASATWRTTS